MDQDTYKKMRKEILPSKEKQEELLNIILSKSEEKKINYSRWTRVAAAVVLIFLISGVGAYAASKSGFIQTFFQSGNEKVVSEYVARGVPVKVGNYEIRVEQSLVNKKTGTSFIYFSVKRISNKDLRDCFIVSGLTGDGKLEEKEYVDKMLDEKGIHTLRENELPEDKVYIFEMQMLADGENEPFARCYYDEKSSTDNELFFGFRYADNHTWKKAKSKQFVVVDQNQTHTQKYDGDIDVISIGGNMVYGREEARADLPEEKSVPSVILTSDKNDVKIKLSSIDMQVYGLSRNAVLKDVSFIDTDWVVKKGYGDEPEDGVIYPFDQIVDINTMEITIDGIVYKK